MLRVRGRARTGRALLLRALPVSEVLQQGMPDAPLETRPQISLQGAGCFAADTDARARGGGVPRPSQGRPARADAAQGRDGEQGQDDAHAQRPARVPIAAGRAHGQRAPEHGRHARHHGVGVGSEAQQCPCRRRPCAHGARRSRTAGAGAPRASVPAP